MADIKYMKAVEWDKLPAAFKKANSQRMAAHAGMWLQRKYDGCYGEAAMSTEHGDRMLSREGLDYTKSCAHILRALREAGFTDGSIIGEVYAKDVPFPEISGRFRRQSKGEQDLIFVMHDLKSDDPYTTRYDRIRTVRNQSSGFTLCVADTYEVGEWDGDPLEWAIVWKAEGGYDGAILRDPTKGYTNGLVKQGEIVKVKPVLSLDLLVGLVYEKPGEKTGRPVYTLDVTYRGVTTRVGSGVPHKAEDLPRPGSIIQIDSMGLTEDGALREPRYIGIRHDKDTPDE